MDKKKEYGQGPLFVITNYIYILFLNSVFFIVCNLLFFIIAFVLKPTLANMIFFFIGLIPMGPALSALIYATEKQIKDKEFAPMRLFFHGYKKNMKDTLKIWLPLLIIVFVLIVDLQDFNRHTSLYHSVLSIVFLIAILLLVIASFYALLISTLYAFRTLDLVRLSFFYLFTKVKATLGNVALIIIVFFVATLTSSLLIILLSSIICYFFVLNSRGILIDVKENFVKE